MSQKAFQDYYPDELSHCYGCGRLNEKGYQIKSHWDGEESVAVFQPESYHLAMPGFVYGGLIASLIDCHGTGTASAAAYRAELREMDTDPPLRFVTASLHVDYLRPTPIGTPLEIRGRVREIKGRKVVNLLKEIFDIDIVVGKSIYSTDAGVFTDLWGDNAIMGYVPSGARSYLEPSFAFTLRKKAHPWVDKYDTDGGKLRIVRTTDNFVAKMVGNEAGYIIKDTNG